MWIINTRGGRYRTKFLPYSSHSSWLLLFVRGSPCRLAGERIITGLSLMPGWLDWKLLTDCKQYCMYVVLVVEHSLELYYNMGSFLIYILHIKWETYLTWFFVLWCSLGSVWCCSRAYWHDTVGPVFYWLFCHAALCWTWFWWRSAVSTVAQFPVVWLACCQCHSAVPCGVPCLCKTSSY